MSVDPLTGHISHTWRLSAAFGLQGTDAAWSGLLQRLLVLCFSVLELQLCCLFSVNLGVKFGGTFGSSFVRVTLHNKIIGFQTRASKWCNCDSVLFNLEASGKIITLVF